MASGIFNCPEDHKCLTNNNVSDKFVYTASIINVYMEIHNIIYLSTFSFIFIFYIPIFLFLKITNFL